ncbi:MAG: hypothetical protein V1652_01120 [bacterium]
MRKKEQSLNKIQTWLPIIAAVAAVAFFFGATYYVVVAEKEVVRTIQNIAIETPEVFIVPKMYSSNATLYQRQFTEHSSLSYYNVLFRVPWTGVPEEEIGPRGVTLKFADDKAVLFTKGSFDARKLIYEVFGDKAGEAVVEKMIGVYGSQFINDPYIFYREILNSTPDNITFLTIQKKAEMEMFLLMLKQQLVSLGKDTIYEFETYYARGFQFGTENDLFVIVDFFNRENQLYSFLIRKGTQEDIDFIISSIR